jgi:hypothetical protein
LNVERCAGQIALPVQPERGNFHGLHRPVNTYPSAVQSVGCDNACLSTHKRVENGVAHVAGTFDNALQQSFGFLGGITDFFSGDFVPIKSIFNPHLQRVNSGLKILSALKIEFLLTTC